MHTVAGLPDPGPCDRGRARGRGRAHRGRDRARRGRGARLCGGAGRRDRRCRTSSSAPATPRAARRTRSADFDGALVVTYGDMPLADAGDVRSLASRRGSKSGLSIVAFQSAEHAAYGRVIIDARRLARPYRRIQGRDAGRARRSICAMPASWRPMRESFFRWAAKLEEQQRAEANTTSPTVPDDRQGAMACGCAVVDRRREHEMMGVNSPRRTRRCGSARCSSACAPRRSTAGVGMTAPETVFLCHDTVLEADVQIGPYVVFGPGVTVRSGAEIKAFSHLEGAEVDERRDRRAVCAAAPRRGDRRGRRISAISSR